MTSRTSLLVGVCSGFIASILALAPSVQAASASPLTQRLLGRILLQVEQRGEAWYIDPVTRTRISLGSAEQAYTLMRTHGLGIRHAELETYLATQFPTRLAGRIVLDVERHGEAYYISPLTRRGTYLANAADAYTLMRQAGLGISTATLLRIPVHASQPSPETRTQNETTPVRFATVERAVFEQINAYRQSKSLPPLTWDDTVATVARTHSEHIAANTVPFSHDGFDDRRAELIRRANIGWMAENIDSNIYEGDPAESAVRSWIESTGHRSNIEHAAFTHTGIGVAQSTLDEYFLTQIFVSK